MKIDRDVHGSRFVPGGRFDTPADIAKHRGEFALEQLLNISAGLVPKQAEAVFCLAADAHNDNDAKKLLEYVMAAARLETLTNQAKLEQQLDTARIVRDIPFEALDALFGEVADDVARCFAILWRGMPAFVEKYHPESSGGTKRLSTLLETRRTMVAHVAERWVATESAEVRDELWGFLFLAAHADFNEEALIVLQELEQALTLAASSPMLKKTLLHALQHMAGLAGDPSGVQTRTLRGLLLGAWARIAQFEDFREVMKVIK